LLHSYKVRSCRTRSGVILQFYRELIRLRKELAPLARLSKEDCQVTGFENERVLLLNRRSVDERVASTFNFNHFPAAIALPLSEGRWNKVLDSTDVHWQGIGSRLPATIEAQGTPSLTLPPDSVAVFTRSASESAN